jgi:hypothetical protein
MVRCMGSLERMFGPWHSSNRVHAKRQTWMEDLFYWWVQLPRKNPAIAFYGASKLTYSQTYIIHKVSPVFRALRGLSGGREVASARANRSALCPLSYACAAGFEPATSELALSSS